MKIKIPRIRLLAYGPSKSAKKLAKNTGITRLKVVHTTFVPRPYDLIINWGSNTNPFPNHVVFLNPPTLVSLVTNKIKCLMHLANHEINVPECTTSKETAIQWIEQGSIVVCRKLIKSKGGKGIVLIRPENIKELPNAPLYTKYVPKKDEYRVHIFNNKVIDIQQKKKRSGIELPENGYQIRSYENGWIFCRKDVNIPNKVVSEAYKAYTCSGLYFGAIDVGYTVKTNKATVYEINTAPGLEGTTLQNYTDAVIAAVNNYKKSLTFINN